MVATITQMMEEARPTESSRQRRCSVTGLRFVPELKWLKFMSWHIREEMEHYKLVVRMYKAFTGERRRART